MNIKKSLSLISLFFVCVFLSGCNSQAISKEEDNSNIKQEIAATSQAIATTSKQETKKSLPTQTDLKIKNSNVPKVIKKPQVSDAPPVVDTPSVATPTRQTEAPELKIAECQATRDYLLGNLENVVSGFLQESYTKYLQSFNSTSHCRELIEPSAINDCNEGNVSLANQYAKKETDSYEVKAKAAIQKLYIACLAK